MLYEVITVNSNVKAISNWIMGDLMRAINEKEIEFSNIPVAPEDLAGLIGLIDKGTITGKAAKKVFDIMFETGKKPMDVVKEEGLEAVNDEAAILLAVKEAISNNPKSVEDYKAGKKQAIGFLVGQIMKSTKGKAQPQTVNELLVKELEK